MRILNVEYLSHGFGDRAIFEDIVTAVWDCDQWTTKIV